jgi:hypothetical protein
MNNSRTLLRVYALPCLVVAVYFGFSASYALFNFENYVSSTPHLIRYLIAPALISLVFIFCALFLRRDSNLLVGLLGLSVLAAFFSMETIASARAIPVILGNLGYVDAEESTYDDLHSGAVRIIAPKGVNRVLNITKLSEAHLSASIPHAKTLLCSKGGSPVYYVSDRYGFNNAENAYATPADIVVLGDSIVEGFCVQPGKDVVSQLRRTFPKSVGLAVRSNGPLMELATLGRYGPVLRPRHVVFTFFAGNDWRNMGAELNSPLLREALSPNADFGSPAMQYTLLERARPLMPHKRDIDISDILFNTRFVRNFLALQQTSRLLGLYYPAAPKKIPKFETVLQRARELTESWGGQLHVLYIPRMDREVGLFPNEFAFDALSSEVLSVAQKLGVPTINMAEFFDEYPDAEVRFYSLGHLSEEGARFVADTISSNLREFDED